MSLFNLNKKKKIDLSINPDNSKIVHNHEFGKSKATQDTPIKLNSPKNFTIERNMNNHNQTDSSHITADNNNSSVHPPSFEVDNSQKDNLPDTNNETPQTPDLSKSLLSPDLVKNTIIELLLDEDSLILEKALLHKGVMQKNIEAILSFLEDKYELTPTKLYRESADKAKSELEHLNEQVQVAQQQHDEIKLQTSEYIANLSQIAASHLQELVKNVINKGK